MPISNAWKEWNYVRVLNGFDRSASNYKKAYQELQIDNARMKRLASHVDFVCPSIYTFSNLNGASYDKCWDQVSINAINEARQYGKPVYAFVWPQFNDLKGKNGDNVFIPSAFWRHELELLMHSGADGLIIWGSSTFRKSGWDPNDPWWKLTVSFLNP
jgi:hypothetical protein